MDFGIYPPEINSGRMYAGPGSGPMLAAAQAWTALADELYVAASSFQSVVSDLAAGAWSGPSSASMAAAAASYVEWLSATAAQAEETANQATAGAGAYEVAFGLTVPPPVIAANRSLLATLVATNFFGQNTAAIAATEAQYAEMWAQDAAAMFTYAGSSASATTLTPFTSPRQNTDTDGTAAQVAAVSKAVTTPAGNIQGFVSGTPQTLSAAPDAVQSLAAAPAASSSDLLDTLSDLITIFLGGPAGLAGLGVGLPLDILAGPVDLPFGIAGTLVGFHTDDIVSGWNGEESWPSIAPAPVKELPATLTNLPPGTVPTMSAGLGGSNTVGSLSVPPTWAVAAPEIRPLTLASPISSASPVAAAPLGLGSSTTASQMGLAGMTGRAMADPPGAEEIKGSDRVPETRVVACAGGAAVDGDGEAPHSNPRTVVTGVAAKIRELARLRDGGGLTEEEYAQLKSRLLGG